MVKRLIHQLAVLPVMDLDIILPILSPLKHADETLHRECRLALYFRSGSALDAGVEVEEIQDKRLDGAEHEVIQKMMPDHETAVPLSFSVKVNAFSEIILNCLLY